MYIPLQLPPGIQNPFTQATLTISFPRLLYTRNSASSFVSTFKFWGERSSHTIDWNSSSFTYEIVTSYQSFVEYLKDMKVLIVEFRDKRTKGLVAIGAVNFMVILNKFEWVNGEWIVDIQEKKKKIGEFVIKMEYKEGGGRLPPFSNIHNTRNNDMEDKGNNSINDYNSNIVRPQVNFNIADINNPQHYIPPAQNLLPWPILTRPKSKRDILLELKQLGLLEYPTLSTIPTVNYEFQASKLKLEEMELLEISQMNQKQLHILFSHLLYQRIQAPLNLPYQLLIQFPIIVGKHFKTNIFTIWSVGSENCNVQFNQRISIMIEDKDLTKQQLKQYLACKISIKLMESSKKGMKEKSKGEIRIAELLNELKRNRSVKLGLIKKQKQDKQELDCEIILRQESTSSEQKKEQIIIKPVSEKDHPEINIEHHPLKSIQLQLMIYVGKLHILKPLPSPNLYVRLRMSDNIFKSEPFWKIPQPNFDMLLYIPIPPNHNLDHVILQIWNKKSEEYLIATVKIQLESLNNFVNVPNNCLIGNSLQPYVYIDESREVKTLKNILVGYLELKLAIGTPEQGFNFQKEIKGRKSKNQIHHANHQNIKKSGNNQNNLLPHPDAPTNNVNIQNQQHQSIQSQSSIPNNTSSIQSDSKTHVIDQLPPYVPMPLSSILFHLLYYFSLNENYYRLLDHLLNKPSSFSINQFAVFLHKFQTTLSEFDASRLSYFFVKDLKIDMASFTKCIQNYRQYQEILNSSFSPVIKRLKQQMEYQMMSVNMLQVHLKRYSQGKDQIQRAQFKQSLLNMFQISLADADKLYQFSKNINQEVSINELCCSLRRYDIHNDLRAHRYPYDIFSSFMFRQLDAVLTEIPQVIETIQFDETIVNCNQLVQTFGAVGIELSLLEAYVIIDKVKDRFGEKKLDEGLVRNEMLMDWLMPRKMFRSPTFGLIHQKKDIYKKKKTEVEQKAREKKLSLEFSFPIKPAQIKVFEEEVPFYQQSITDIIINVKRQMQDFKIKIITKDQILKCEGRIGEWAPVLEDGSYVGEVLIR